MSGSLEVLHRQGVPERDAVEAARIIVVALNDLHLRQNRPPLTGTGEEMSAVLAHMARTDPTRFWVAVHEERIVGFGIAWLRSQVCYLSGLFVHPDWQGRGLGRGLMERAMHPSPVAGGISAVMSSAANPVSNGLYARRGMYPFMPVLYLKGRIPAGHALAPLGMLQPVPLTAADLVDLYAIDGAATGLDRSPDHSWLLGEAGRQGWLFRRHGEAAGYGYLGGDGTEGDDAVGPVATVRSGRPGGRPRASC